MELFAALAFGWVEWTFLAVFFLLMVVGTSFDRAGQESPKWYVLGVGFVAIACYYWKDLSVSSLWVLLSTWAFWKPIVVYFMIGLAYSMLEFFLDVRRSARGYAAEWQRHLNTEIEVPVLDADGKVKMKQRVEMRRGVSSPVTMQNGNDITSQIPVMDPEMRSTTFAEGYGIVKEKGAESNLFNGVNAQTKSFLSSYRFKNRIIEIQLAADKIGVEPKVNRLELAEHIGAWTFLWPMYAVNLIIGDLLTEVFRSIADFLTHISGRFVKLSFANVFKF